MKKSKAAMGFCVTNDIVLTQVRVCHERVFVDNIVSNFSFVRLFSPKNQYKFIANFAAENVSQVRTEERKTRSIICKVNLNILRSRRHLHCNTGFTVIVFFLNEGVHGFTIIRNRRVKTK